jgi:hypothetical protein
VPYAFRAAFGVNVVDVLLHGILVTFESFRGIQHGLGAAAP